LAESKWSLGPIFAFSSGSQHSHVSSKSRYNLNNSVKHFSLVCFHSPTFLFSLNSSSLSMKSCSALSAMLSSQNCLRLLDFSNNDLQDLGVEQLCLGLKSPECRLETLRLSGCLVSEKGGTFLVSALSSTSSCLKELDLSYNHPGNATTENLSVLLKDPQHSFVLRLELSKDNRKVTFVSKDLPYPDHPDRFDSCRQVLCSTELTGRCYWEVDWEEDGNNWEVDVAVSYRGMGRTGSSGFGLCDRSWCLKISRGGYSVLHGGIQTPVSSSYSSTDRVAVYLDGTAGTLTFYNINNNNDGKPFHLHTFTTTFTEPLYAGLGFGLWSSVKVSH
uniref:B30.2/SPRY domain-containing protein n=1 Tax=Neogobius melanostomus TaxID=47308 RepID=A0A8C6U960_9GOBI